MTDQLLFFLSRSYTSEFDSEGEIYLAGQRAILDDGGDPTGGTSIVIRYNSNGTLDTSFNSVGIRISDISGSSCHQILIDEDDDNKLSLVGASDTSGLLIEKLIGSPTGYPILIYDVVSSVGGTVFMESYLNGYKITTYFI